ncbi:MAG: hypothetical protein OXF27_13690 [Acidobacteria bacterium]|nr:hypothetical protein [Acidobacteriota bacterium]
MKSSIFSEEELVDKFENNWDPPSGWQNISELSEQERISLCRKVLRRLHDYKAAVTLIDMSDQTTPQPLGSGVLVRGGNGYGVLTAGHVCTEVERRDLPNNQGLWCLPVLAENRTGEPLRRIPLGGVKLRYSKDATVPDYGCIVMPTAKGRDAAAWGTFVNITEEGRCRRKPLARLEHGVWVAAGYVEEKSRAKAIFLQYLIGAPEAVYQRAGLRYFYVIDQNNEQGVPRSIAGMSGSGVWRLPVTRSRNEPTDEIGTPILAGVSFRQEYCTSDEPLAFYAHDLESIADEVLQWLDGNHP